MVLVVAVALARLPAHPCAQALDLQPPLMRSQLCTCDLGRWLAEHPPPLHERHAAAILRQLLTALAAAHRAGIAYRDVKPQNLLVRGLDADGLPALALADFGCCRSTAGPRPTARAVSAGTPLFSAPECVHGACGCEGDLWSAGVLLYLLLSGRYPFCDPSVPISQGEYWRRVCEVPIHFAGPAWHHASPGAVALCRRLLDRDCSRWVRVGRAPAAQGAAGGRAECTAPHAAHSLRCALHPSARLTQAHHRRGCAAGPLAAGRRLLLPRRRHDGSSSSSAAQRGRRQQRAAGPAGPAPPRARPGQGGRVSGSCVGCSAARTIGQHSRQPGL